ncbi:hypothetical protein B0H12DRAFT_595954 [Mycena haematopus]|nr:hypothetical protein B0H12DRAFT_595954 [Mycena haematopus]
MPRVLWKTNSVTKSIWKDNETVWHAWESECDSCGRSGSEALKGQLLSCAGCLVARYCSKKCQQMDWKGGHKNQCHLYEANRKLSSVFAKSLGPGYDYQRPQAQLEGKGYTVEFLERRKPPRHRRRRSEE